MKRAHLSILEGRVDRRVNVKDKDLTPRALPRKLRALRDPGGDQGGQDQRRGQGKYFLAKCQETLQAGISALCAAVLSEDRRPGTAFNA